MRNISQTQPAAACIRTRLSSLHARLFSLHARLSLLFLFSCLLALPDIARATTVSRLGAVYFYDAMLFDAALLQRGAQARGGYGSEGGLLETGIDLSFYQEASLRVGYTQRFDPGAPDGHDVSWRLRMPISEEIRYGHLSSSQILYAGSHSFQSADPLTAAHEVDFTHSISLTRGSFATTLHGQLGVVVRPAAQASSDLSGSRVGVALRLAHLFPLYRPPPGFGGKWTVTFSSVEIDAVHYGASSTRPGDGRIRLTFAAPAVHFTHRYATYTLGLMPVMTFRYDGGNPRLEWSGLGNLNITYRHFLE